MTITMCVKRANGVAMLIKVKRGWELPDRAATHESVYRSRRTLLKAIAAGPILASAGSLVTLAGTAVGFYRMVQVLRRFERTL